MQRRDYPRHQRPAVAENEIMEYRIDRSSFFGSYVAIVKVDMITRKTKILLYDCEPVTRGLWGMYTEQNDHICEGNAGPLTDINAAITRMITEYEIPLYQRYAAENVDTTYLEIDHAEEIKKRRARLANPTTETKETEPNYPPPEIHDYQYKGDADRTFTTIDGGRKGVHANSLANLKQNQNDKKFG
jgi:hypothetical protein